jgi:hypothetical protein
MAWLIKEFWDQSSVVPIPALARLREQVLRHNDNKRCPKWAFRLDPDLVVQIQPRPCLLATRPGLPQRVVEFRGLAHSARGDVVPHNAFRLTARQLRAGGGDWLRLGFVLFALDGDVMWDIQVRSVRWSRRVPPETLFALRNRVYEALPDRLATLRPELMLSPRCLYCGKALTDPASIARWIGPECAGSGALAVPGMDRDHLAEQLLATTAE